MKFLIMQLFAVLFQFQMSSAMPYSRTPSLETNFHIMLNSTRTPTVKKVTLYGLAEFKVANTNELVLEPG
jgi:hypothetical protein